MGRILSLSGTELYGQSIQIKPSEMEKNVQWTLQKQVQQGMMTAATSPSTNPTHLPAPGIDVAAAATAAAAKLLCTTGTKSLLNPITNTQEDQRQRKIYIGNLPREINELVLRNMFEPFGIVESSNVIKDSTGKSQGYGFILFREKEIVEKAIHAMNGMLIGSNIIKVNYVASSGSSLPIHSHLNSIGQLQMHGNPLCSIASNVDLDRVDDDGSLKINSQNRMLLMQKLACSAKIDFTTAPVTKSYTQIPLEQELASQSVPESLITMEGLLGASSLIPTNCLLLKNMFNPILMNSSEQDTECEIYEDVKAEAIKTGTVLHIFVDKYSQGFVYVKMMTIDSAMQTYNILNGRVYGGRKILVEYQSTHAYENAFKY